MDLERRPVDLLRHHRALDVPAGPAAPPRRVPPRVLGGGLVRLPEREVARIAFQRRRLFSLLDLIEPLTRKPPVLGEALDTEVHVAAARVRVPALDQLLDERDDLRHRLSRLRHPVGLTEPEVARVLEVPLGCLRGQLSACARRGVVDLVVDVGDVVDELRVVAAQAQPRPQPHPDDERPCVADVCARVDRRPAEVHPHRPGSRRQIDERPRGRVVEAHAMRVMRGGVPRRAAGRAVRPTAPAPARPR